MKAFVLLAAMAQVESFLQEMPASRRRVSLSSKTPVSLQIKTSHHHDSAEPIERVVSRRTLVGTSIRNLLACAASATLANPFPSSSAWADDSANNSDTEPSLDSTANNSYQRTKPFAPLEKLLPAARVKWTIDESLEIVKSMATTSEDRRSSSSSSWQQLETLLLRSQNYMAGQQTSSIPSAPAQAYLDTYQRNRQSLAIVAQPGAWLVQSGEIDAWKRLKRQEAQREEEDEIRAALNLYTSALNYNAQAYLLNVAAAERKQMIRQDRLPDVKQVIQSDMGLRYLYRNELLTAMQQVRSEVEYQLSQDSPSSEDLLSLLRRAQDACNQWFAFIDEKDAAEAIAAVSKEQSMLST